MHLSESNIHCSPFGHIEVTEARPDEVWIFVEVQYFPFHPKYLTGSLLQALFSLSYYYPRYTALSIPA